MNDTFHNELIKYMNGWNYTPLDAVFSLLPPIAYYKKYSKYISQKHRNECMMVGSGPHQAKCKIESYVGSNLHVLRMKEYLHENLNSDLVAAIVHGSLGTYEEIPYSDFDALVIIKDEVFEDPSRLSRVATSLNKALSIMDNYDNLQHHGWFVLAECQLRSYPEAYFPHTLFAYAKTLLPAEGIVLKVDSWNDDMTKAFDTLSSGILKKLSTGNFPTDVFALKGLLSQFMFLPALYVQARDNKGTFKKESFNMARTDFSQEEWGIMDEVSDIRAIWNYRVSPVKSFLISRQYLLRRRIASLLKIPIPDAIRERLDENMLASMIKLVHSMRQRISDNLTEHREV